MPQLTLLEVGDSQWTGFVQASPKALPFHRPEWAQLLADCYGYRVFAFSLEDAAGHISAGLPILEIKSPFGARRWVSLPFTDYCPPLATSEEASSSLINQLDRERRTRGIAGFEVRAPLTGNNVHRRPAAVTHTLRLAPDPNAVFRTFKASVQRAVLKAGREGVTIVGLTNLPSTMPYHASMLYSRNVQALLLHLAAEGELALDWSDEITSGACVAGKKEAATA